MRLLADENFDNRILDGVRRIVPDIIGGRVAYSRLAGNA